MRGSPLSWERRGFTRELFPVGRERPDRRLIHGLGRALCPSPSRGQAITCENVEAFREEKRKRTSKTIDGGIEPFFDHIAGEQQVGDGSLMEGMNALFASLLLDEQARVIDGNRDAEVLLGCPLEEARKIPLEKLNSSLFQILKDLLDKARRGKGVENYSFAYKLGRRLTRLMASVTPYPLEALGSVGTLVTIKGEAAVRRPASAVEERIQQEKGDSGDFKSFLQILPEPAFLLDEEGNFLFANQALCRLIGHSPEDILGRPLSFLLGRDHPPGTQEKLLEASLLAPWRGELQLQGQGGRTFLRATCSLIPMGEDGGRCFLFLAWDCGDEVRIRREREGEIKKLWGRLDATGLGIVAFTPDRRITAFSVGAEEALGVGREVAIGSLLEEILPLDLKVMREVLEAVAQEGEAAFSMTLKGKREGKDIHYECRARKVEGGDPKAPETVILLAPTEKTNEPSEEELWVRKWWEERFYSLCLESMLQGSDEEVFWSGALRLFEGEKMAEGGAVLVVEGGGLRLSAAFGLDLRERERLAGLRPRGDSLNLWTFSPFLEISFQGGIPRRGWDEAKTYFEDPECLSRLAGERRWKSVAVFPVGRKEVVALLVLGGLHWRHSDVLCAVEAMLEGWNRARALRSAGAAYQGKSAKQGGVAKAAGRRETHGLTKGFEVDQGLTLLPTEEDAASEENTGKDPSSPSSAGEFRGELLLKAREAKGQDSAEEIPLWSKRFPSRSGGLLDLNDFAKRLRRRMQEIHGNVLLFEVEEDLPRVYLDEGTLENLLLSLVGDAVEASPSGSPVVFGVERWGDEILFRVEDQGMPPFPGTDGEGGALQPTPSAGERGGEPQSVPKNRESRLKQYEELARRVRGSLTWKSTPGEGNVVYLRVGIIPFLGRAEA